MAHKSSKTNNSRSASERIEAFGDQIRIIGALGIWLSILAGLLLLGYAVIMWAKSGVWHSLTMAEWFANNAPSIPRSDTGWVGIDQIINDQIDTGSLWVLFLFWAPIALGLITWAVGGLFIQWGQDLDRKRPLRKRQE